MGVQSDCIDHRIAAWQQRFSVIVSVCLENSPLSLFAKDFLSKLQDTCVDAFYLRRPLSCRDNLRLWSRSTRIHTMELALMLTAPHSGLLHTKDITHIHALFIQIQNECRLKKTQEVEANKAAALCQVFSSLEPKRFHKAAKSTNKCLCTFAYKYTWMSA